MCIFLILDKKLVNFFTYINESIGCNSVMDMSSCRPMGASVARLVILVSGARSRSWN